MSLNYRMGTIDDIENVFRLSRAVLNEAWSKSVMLQSLQIGYDLYVCYQGETLVGYVLSQDILLETQIMQVCVHQDVRRMGVGKTLMLMLMKEKQDMNELILEVRDSNTAAQQFYKYLGFEQVGLRPNYYSQSQTKPREDAVVMVYPK
ncbi:MAG: ribosomal protein S18-alanine N-acetyltransferase [Ghiorsea sp.]|nr:ribosomal protein S18-alanine N-acetyltransferase [Ghiorsea sp.]